MGVLIEVKRPPKFRDFDPNQPPRPDQPGKSGDEGQSYAARLREFVDRKAMYEHPIRMREARIWREAELYEMSRQWLQPSYNSDPTRTPHLSDVHFKKDDPDEIPMPSYNEIAPAMQNEAARLGRPEYKPYVRPKGENPTAKDKEAAKTAVEILLDSLEYNNWDTDVAEPGFHHTPLYGRWRLKAFWDVSYDDTIRVAVTTAMRCPAEGCDFKLANTELSVDEGVAASGHKPDRVTNTLTTNAKGEDVPSYSLDVCMTCDDHEEEQEMVDDGGVPIPDEFGQPLMGPVRMPGPPKLEPFTPIDDELHEQDALGRELGEDEAVGRLRFKTCSPFDMFDSELGQDGGGTDWREITEYHVESLDWSRARFPKAAEEIAAEDPKALLKWHPTCGEQSIYAESAGGDPRNALFRNHSRVKEYHKKPFMEWDPKKRKFCRNHGRSIMLTSGKGGKTVILMDGDFEMPSKRTPGAYIPRVHYDSAVWEYRSGAREKNGISLFELIRDAQDNINQASSQRQDARERMASPGWIQTRNMNLSYERTASAGFQWVVDAPTDNSAPFPQQVGSTTISPGVSEEIQDDRDYIQRASGKSEVEEGNVPKTVTAAAAIQLLAEQTAERRRPRIRRIRKMLERTWSYGLTILHEMVIEPRTYRVKDRTNNWKERTWTGADILGHTDIRIDAEPDHNTSVVRLENIQTGIQNGVIPDPRTNKKVALRIAKEMEISSQVLEDDDLQYQSAEKEFWNYLDLGDQPVVDPLVDDDAAHSDQHGTNMLGPEWQSLEADAKWKVTALPKLCDWEQVYHAMVEANDTFNEAKAHPAPPPPPPMPPAPGMMMAAPLPPEPPPQQPPVIFTTPDLQARIVEVWSYLLAQEPGAVDVEAMPPEQREAFDKVMTFRAHKATHVLRLEAKATATQQGQQVAAAPGTDAAPDGTMPTAEPPAPAM